LKKIFFLCRMSIPVCFSHHLCLSEYPLQVQPYTPPKQNIRSEFYDGKHSFYIRMNYETWHCSACKRTEMWNDDCTSLSVSIRPSSLSKSAVLQPHNIDVFQNKREARNRFASSSRSRTLQTRQLSSETLNPPDVNLEKKHEFVHQSSQSGVC
jgi:hypothetical protein